MSASNTAPIIHSIKEPVADYLHKLLISGVPEMDYGESVAYKDLSRPTIQQIDMLNIEANQLLSTEVGPIVRIEIIRNKRSDSQRRSGIFWLTASYWLPFAYITGADDDIVLPYMLKMRGIPAHIVSEALAAKVGKSYAIVFSRQKTMMAGDVEVSIAGFDDDWQWWKAR